MVRQPTSAGDDPDSAGAIYAYTAVSGRIMAMRRCNSDTICLGSGILPIFLSRSWDTVANEILQCGYYQAFVVRANIGMFLVTEWSQKSSPSDKILEQEVT